jgi:hypothetical protein
MNLKISLNAINVMKPVNRVNLILHMIVYHAMINITSQAIVKFINNII